jgi:hypothetical protein
VADHFPAPEDVRTIYDVVFTRYRQDDYEVVQEVMAALGAAGRLLPPGAERREQWRVEYLINGVQRNVSRNLPSRQLAEAWLEVYVNGAPNITEARITRQEQIYIDAPWVELDETTPEDNA